MLKGEQGASVKLCAASLDLQLTLHQRWSKLVTRPPPQAANEEEEDANEQSERGLWTYWWPYLVESIAESGKTSQFGPVRQQALAMLKDVVISQHATMVSTRQLQAMISTSCIAVAGFRINSLLQCNDIEEFWEEIMNELKLCIALLFKPLLHHLRPLQRGNLIMLWEALLGVMEQLLMAGDDDEHEHVQTGHPTSAPANTSLFTRTNLLLTTKELATEHLRNAIMVLMTTGILTAKSQQVATETSLELSTFTWEALNDMSFLTKQVVEDWQVAGMNAHERAIRKQTQSSSNSTNSVQQEPELKSDEDEDYVDVGGDGLHVTSSAEQETED